MTTTKYKHTEIGIIPSDWEVKNISRCCSMKARIGWQGLTKSEYQNSGGYILITGTDFENGEINWNTVSYVSKKRFDQDKNIQIKNGDILITKDGTIGKVAFLQSIPKEGTLNSGVFVIRPIKTDIYKLFLSYIFKSKYFDSFINELIAGSTINHLYQKDFVKFQIPLPPTLAEQEAIAGVLSDMDALLAALDKLIAKKRQIKTAAMQKLLHPANNQQWEVKKLGEIAKDIKTGKRNGNEEVVDGKYPFFVRSKNISKINSYSFDGEAILIPGEGGIGEIFHYINGKFDFHQRVYKISNFIDDIDGKFIYFYLKHNFGKYALENSVKATVESLRLPTQEY